MLRTLQRFVFVCALCALVLLNASPAFGETQTVSCPTCGGRGSVGGAPCSLCGGSGTILMSGSRDGRDRANDITGTQPGTSYKSVLVNGRYLSLHLYADGVRSTLYQKLRALDADTLVHLRPTRDPATYETLCVVGTAQALSELLGEGVNGFHVTLEDGYSAADYERTREMLAAPGGDSLSYLHLMFVSGKNAAFIMTERELTDDREASLASALDAWLQKDGAGQGQALPAGFENVLFACVRQPRHATDEAGVVDGSVQIDGSTLKSGAFTQDSLVLHLYGGTAEARAYSLGVAQSQSRFTVIRHQTQDADYVFLVRDGQAAL